MRVKTALLPSLFHSDGSVCCSLLIQAQCTCVTATYQGLPCPEVLLVGDGLGDVYLAFDVPCVLRDSRLVNTCALKSVRQS